MRNRPSSAVSRNSAVARAVALVAWMTRTPRRWQASKSRLSPPS
ncbi:hypothetical protein ACFSTJ_13890 [Ottowia pentelensis]